MGGGAGGGMEDWSKGERLMNWGCERTEDGGKGERISLIELDGIDGRNDGKRSGRKLFDARIAISFIVRPSFPFDNKTQT